MIKFLPLLVLVVAIFGVFAYYNFGKQPAKNGQNLNESMDISNLNKRVKTLEGAVLQLSGGSISSGNTGTQTALLTNSAESSDFNTRLNTLEVLIADLQGRIKKLESVTNIPVSSTQTQIKQSPVYILSLGSGDKTTSTDWVTAANIDITVDPASFPGYTTMQLEAQVKVLSGNGKVFARLYDSAAGTAVLSSEVSTAAEDYSWVSSAAFTLSSTKKTYKFQIKTLTGYEASIQAARIKVNF